MSQVAEKQKLQLLTSKGAAEGTYAAMLHKSLG